jgi:TPR repeat protein
MDAYDDGQLVLALRLMEECAMDGDPMACFTTALWYQYGEGVPLDLERSAQWLARHEELAEQGNLEAQWDVGQNYRFANLQPLNIELANYWLERAAENGWGEAQHHLAWYLETGQYGYAVDRQAAEVWYRRAFEQGHPETLYTFALREFQDGKITEKAIELLTQAAEKGFQQAAHVLREHRH